MIDLPSHLGESPRRILITGGAGFIGGALVRRLLRYSNSIVFNLDKCSYASDLTGIKEVLADLGSEADKRYQLLRVDLVDAEATKECVRKADPDLVMHLAAESHVDRSIDAPNVFLESNVIGSFNLLQAVRLHWEALSKDRKASFRFHHISTDEVFGSLGNAGRFNESSPYDPRSPYSATKAASDHLVSAWHHTYGLPVVLTNCSNNYGPWQFPEKLIPVVILKAVEGELIPLYGDGANVRDWLHVEDHVDALILAATKGELGSTYCIGGFGERTNKQVVESICRFLDERLSLKNSCFSLITKVPDRPGHDKRYAIDPKRIITELGWKPCFEFEAGLAKTVDWYLANIDWCTYIRNKANYFGERIGLT